MSDLTDYEKQRHAELIGGTVRAIEVEDDGEGVWVTLVLAFPATEQEPNGHELEVTVSRDPEGNGPGHLFIAPPEDPEDT